MNAEQRLRSTCTDVFARVASTFNLSQRNVVTAQLVAAYCEPHRAYHTVAHIAALLELLDLHAATVRDADLVTLAILYHDAVYDPRRADNEAASAEVARQDLAALGVNDGRIERVSHLVLATQHGVHVPDAHDKDLALLLDLDLSVLAAPAADYDVYARAIRREYSHVPDLLYRPGRRRVLQKFINADQLYLTPTLQTAWQHAAKANLIREIGSL
jgi:predicted metal-dependent HD superfamily phosphohydrolase